MKTKKVELDVDFIGGQTSLTKEEEKTLSEYIQKIKSKRKKATFNKTKPIKQLI
jgi:uncharacterized protein YifE (UPF0438 family)